jgi:hypothetical protein
LSVVLMPPRQSSTRYSWATRSRSHAHRPRARPVIRSDASISARPR